MRWFAFYAASFAATVAMAQTASPTPEQKPQPTPAMAASPMPIASVTPAPTPAPTIAPAPKAGPAAMPTPMPSATPDAAAPAAATAEQSVASQIRFPVEKYTLPNGLVVLLSEDHSAPVISYQTWFRVGSKYEEVGYTGIAHLFEHMMFTGTPKYSREAFDSVLQANGATNNAFTTNDYTGYYENLPSAKFELVMDIESDRMTHLQVTEENLKSEREVVKEERRYRVDNNPTGILREVLYSTAYKVNPYKWPVLGSMTDLARISAEKARQFYKTYYSPNNAVLVIAGDFKSDDAKKLIEKYYSAIPSQAIPKKVIVPEPKQSAPRSQFVRRDVQNMTLAFAYHVPQAGSDDSYPLDLLAEILGHGTGSRLYKRLVYKSQVATSVNVADSTMQDSGLFQVFINLKPNQGIEPGQKYYYGEMWYPRNKPVTADELATAKKQIAKEYVDSLKTVYGKAESLAQNEILFGDYSRLFTDLDHYDKVDAADVLRVTKKYLSPEQSTLVAILPTRHAQKGAKGETESKEQ